MTKTIDDMIKDVNDIVKKATVQTVLTESTDNLFKWYEQLNNPSIVRIREQKKRNAARSIDNKTYELIGENSDFVSKSDKERKEKTTEIITEMAKMWYKARYNQKDEDVKDLDEQKIEDFLELAGITPDRLGVSGYGSGLAGALKYISDNEASLDTSDENNGYLNRIKQAVVSEMEGQQEKALSRIKGELTNHRHYDKMLPLVKKLTGEPINTNASPMEILREADKFYADKLKKPPDKSYLDKPTKS